MAATPRSIGIMMRMTGSMAGRILKGFRSVSVEQGWHIHVLRWWDGDDRIPYLIRKWSLDAVFVEGTLYEKLDPLVWEDRPVVVFAPPAPAPGASSNTATIAFDDHAIGAAAAAHLMDRGLRTFAAILRDRPLFATHRFAGFQQALRGMPVQCWDDSMIRTDRTCDPDDLYGIIPWLRSLPQPCGLFVPCDVWGIWILEWCQAAGVRVPEHVAVISVDGDDGLCEFAETPLTSIDLPWEQLARAAARQLVNMLTPDKSQSPANCIPLAPGKVIMRRSTDVLAIDDCDVREALAMISAEALGPLRPNDVIAHVAASRNRFRENFHRLVGRTLSEEIRRVRIEEAKRLLAHCELPVEEIARRCGFANSALLNTAFVNVAGCTPGAYRKRSRT